jgi:hypothetical protein
VIAGEAPKAIARSRHARAIARLLAKRRGSVSDEEAVADMMMGATILGHWFHKEPHRRMCGQVSSQP